MPNLTRPEPPASPVETVSPPIRQDRPAVAGAATAGSERLLSLDAFRGAIMLLMASSGMGLVQVARQHPESAVWGFVARQVEHAAWVGCTLWDLIQPAFMFMVGVALPWSIANRRRRGQSVPAMFGHAAWRALVLVLLAVFLTSAWSRRTEWVFTNVLAQIGLGYPVVFLLALARPRIQWTAAGVILAGYWIGFAVHPLPAPGFEWGSVGVPPDWVHLQGFAAHWEKNHNAAATFDRWFLNLFPRETPFVFSSGGYQTLNFVPSMATMLFGVLAGQWLRRDGTMADKVRGLVLAGLAGTALGAALAAVGVCPIVKRIWTPTWAVFSGGLVTLMLAGFVAVIEWRGARRWAMPLVVAGLNPITLYCLWQLLGGFVRENFKRHLGPGVFELAGLAWAPVLERAGILMVFWLVQFWMYRRKIFLRI